MLLYPETTSLPTTKRLISRRRKALTFLQQLIIIKKEQKEWLNTVTISDIPSTHNSMDTCFWKSKPDMNSLHVNFI